MNPLNRQQTEELERALGAVPVPPPPPDLLDRIRRDIPAALPVAEGGVSSVRPFRRLALRRLLPLAAGLAIAVAASWVGVRVVSERGLAPSRSARELSSVEGTGPAAPPPAALSRRDEVPAARAVAQPKAIPRASADTGLRDGSSDSSAGVEPERSASRLREKKELVAAAGADQEARASSVTRYAASPAPAPQAGAPAKGRVEANAAASNGIEGGIEGGVVGSVAGGVAGGVPGGVYGGVLGGQMATPSSSPSSIARHDQPVQPAEIAEAKRPARVPPTAPPSTGGTAEPNDQPVGDMFFRATGVNPFVDTEDDRFSTFGLDVDTGSYTLARSYLEGGHLPPTEAIRVEEFVNAFDYPEPVDRRRDFTVHAEGAPSPFARGEKLRLVRFHVQARPISEADRRPADLVFVVDVSGSMAREDRLGLVRQALGLLLGRLREDDRVGLVVYGTRGRVLLAPTSDHEAVRRALGQLVPEGSTNAEEGLRLAYDLAAETFRRHAVRRLILCSDGVANVGATGPESILARIGAAARDGVELSSFGFGMGNYNDALLEQLADQGNGRYAYVDDLAEAERLFVEQAAGTVPTVARDAKAQVEWNPRAVERYRLLGYENRDVADERFRDDRVDAGEIGAGHAVTALYEVKLRDTGLFGRGGERLATLRLRYREGESGAVREAAYDLDRDALAARWSEASANLRLAAVAAELAERLKGSYWAKDSSSSTLLAEARSLARGRERWSDAGAQPVELLRMVERAVALAPRGAGEGPRDEEGVPTERPDPRRLEPRDEGSGGAGRLAPR